jgi:ubiquinone/menaquinone biosynthesis C-methylase UbiE
MGEHVDYVIRDRRQWDRWARDYEEPGRRRWSEKEASWGEWGVPESQLKLLPSDVSGWDVIELGCGTGYVSAWLARRGATPVGIDNSEAQLQTARRLEREHGIEFPLIHGNAEDVAAREASFDLAISEYGASSWCDPYRWIPEAARLLRPGGRRVFLVNVVLAMLTTPDEENVPAADRLLRPIFRDAPV